MDTIDDGEAVAARPARRRGAAATEVEVVEAAPAPSEETAPAKPARDTSNDYGNWQYRPWKGMDHWVHAISGFSTFSRKEAKTRGRAEELEAKAAAKPAARKK